MNTEPTRPSDELVDEELLDDADLDGRARRWPRGAAG